MRLNMRGNFPYYGPTGIIDYIDQFGFDGKYALIGEDGDHFLKWRSRPMTQFVQGKFNVNNHAHVIGAKGQGTIEWFQHFFANRDISEFLTRQGASRYKLTKAALEGLPVMMPPKAEQKAITQVLASADQLIGSIERLISKKQAIKQGLMQRLLTGKTRLSGFTQEWSAREISEVASVDPESLPSGTSSHELLDYISLEDVNRGVLLASTRVAFSKAPSRARRVIRDQDVLFGMVRPNLQSHAVYSGRLKRPIASTGFAVIRASSAHSDPRFLFYLVMSDIASAQIERIIAGSNYPAVSSADVRRLRFDFPSVDEQSAIGAILTDCDFEIDALQNRLAKARALKQGMMQELLTGRTRLRPVEATS